MEDYEGLLKAHLRSLTQERLSTLKELVEAEMEARVDFMLDGAPAKKAKRAAKPKAPPVSAGVWESYCEAYRRRYGEDPVRNAQVNAHMAQLVGRLGAEEAPLVAAFYVGHNNAAYVRRMHDTGLLLQDATGLRTQWARRQQVTATQAQQADRTQTNASAFSGMIEAARRREAEQGRTVDQGHEA